MLELLKTIIQDFHTTGLPKEIVTRQINIPLTTSNIITIIGPRRSGKTYLLYSLINSLTKDIPLKRCVYVNFEDDRLNLKKEDLQLLLDAYQQQYPDIDLKEVYFFFDEIQVVDGWEIFVRRVHDKVSKHVFVTGSSAKLLSKEIATALRGRTITYTLFPFTFGEYVHYQHYLPEDNLKTFSTKQKNLLVKAFEDFMYIGGYPEVISFDTQLRDKTLQNYLDVMMYRDVIERYKITQTHLIKDFLHRIFSSNAKEFSLNKYYHDLKSRGIAISKDTLYQYVSHFIDIYLIFLIPRYSSSYIKQEQAGKKLYVNDTGLLHSQQFEFSSELGRALETAIFLELIKHEKKVFFLKEQHYECDFLIKEKDKIVGALQVCYKMTEENKDREINGLVHALKLFHLNKGIIVTLSQEETITQEGITVSIIPAWKWILTKIKDQ